MIGSAPTDATSSPARRPDRWLLVLCICVVGCVFVSIYAAAAFVQIRVLNPLAAVPGKSVDEIWHEVAVSQGSADIVLVPAILALGPLFGVALLVCALIWLRSAPWTVAASYLGLIVLGTPAYFVASFSPGMNLADTFGINGGDYSPWAQPLYLTSAVAIVLLIGLAAIAVVVAPRRRTR